MIRLSIPHYSTQLNQLSILSHTPILLLLKEGSMENKSHFPYPPSPQGVAAYTTVLLMLQSQRLCDNTYSEQMCVSTPSSRLRLNLEMAVGGGGHTNWNTFHVTYLLQHRLGDKGRLISGSHMGRWG